MANTALDQVQHLVDQLTPLDQVRLLEYLVPRIGQVVVAAYTSGTASTSVGTEAWAELFRLGDDLVAGDSGTGESLTASVLAMRR